MTIKPDFGFLLEYVSDIESAKRFYVDVVGLQAERVHPTFVQFHNFAIASDASLTGTREPEVYWLVKDAEAALKELSPKSKVVIPLKEMPFGKVFAIQDPTGRPLFLLEFARTRPSQAV